MASLCRLLALLAVLLMPLGMAPATAAMAHPPMTMGHCPDQAPHHDAQGGIAECTMACAGALPAANLANREPMPITGSPIQPAAAQQLHGLHPDTATPPPKRS